ncbi:cell wall-binding repeat-containing protein [Antiquaquibacter oligotrophicus]|nr:cell wall-binding repeat-containing protein [Antiquaquibacter oligotrophicus]UDF12423.1 cell wall-binding repeat-containing protein [Antiquaquibacter oligotrophicus]
MALTGGLLSAVPAAAHDGVDHSTEPGADSALDWTNYEKALITKDVGEPIDLAILPDGRIIHTARNGDIRVTDPSTGITTLAATIPVYANSEDGLQTVAIDPDFEENNWVYVVYAPIDADGDGSPDTPSGNAPNTLPSGQDASYWDQWVGVNRLARFQWTGSTIDLASEQTIIDIEVQRGQCCHVGADIDFDGEGNLYLSTGDNTPASTPGANGFAPNNDAPNMNPGFDARRGAGNTNDLRGKILRVHVEDDGSYTIPEGNLFAPGTELTRPEIFVMGVRNPFRLEVDPETNSLTWADYGPDASAATAATAGRGPMGYVEWNAVSLDDPHNSGWPYVTGDNFAYNDWDFATATPGAFFDPENLVNDSEWNTGLTEIPDARPATLYYGDAPGQQPWDELVNFGSGGGQGPMGGPVYSYDDTNPSPTKFPEYWDGKAFMGEFSQDYIAAFTVDWADTFGVTHIEDFLPNSFLTGAGQPIHDNPMDMEFGPDGSLYVLEYGDGFFQQNPDSGLYRISYTQGNLAPQASFTATPYSSSAPPLEVTFDASTSSDPEGGDLTFEWDFNGDGTYEATGVTAAHTYTEVGAYDAVLRVTNELGLFALTSRQISVGNQAPTVTVEFPGNGGFFDWGQDIPYSITTDDPEDGTDTECSRVAWTYGLGHDEHAHPEESGTGCTGVWPTDANSPEHGPGALLYGAVVVTYEDEGAESLPPAVGEASIRLNPKLQQAEHAAQREGVTVVEDATASGGSAVQGFGPGDFLTYTPVNFSGITGAVVRASGAGTVSLHWGPPDHAAAFATATIPAGAGWQDVEIEFTPPVGTGELYVSSSTELSLDSITMVGDGVAVPEEEPEQCVGGLSDEFVGSELDQDRWEVLNPDGSIVVANGSLTMPISRTDFYGTNNTTVPNLVLQPLPDGPFTATTKVTADLAASWQQAGLVIFDDPDNYAKIALQHTATAGERRMQFLREVAGAPNEVAATSNVAVAANFPDTYWVRLTSSDGVSLNAAFSADGITFTNMPETKSLAGMVDPKVGLLAVAGTNAPATLVPASFDFFHVTPDEAAGAPGPDDEFDGTELETCRWTVVNEDTELYGVADGALRIQTTPTDFYQANNTAVPNLILQPQPGDDWVVETKVDGAQLNQQYQQGGIILYGDEDNYAKINFMTPNTAGSAVTRRIEMRSEVNAAIQNPQPQATVTGSTWLLRLEKSGTTFTGSYSADGATWTTFASVQNPNLADAMVGVYALASSSQQASAPVFFDYFRVLAEDPVDETAPTVQASVDDRTVTITASDAGSGVASVEYQLPGGEWTVYTTPFDVPGTDAVTVSFRATDVAGNVSTVATVNVAAEPGEDRVLIPVDQVSMGMYSLGPWVNAEGLEPVLGRLSEIGFENIEPYGANFTGYTAQQFRALTDGLDLSVPSSHYNVNEATFDTTLAYVETLGQEYVGSGGFAAPGIGSYANTLATAETMNRLGERSVAAGVGKFFGHNHASEFTTQYTHDGELMSAWEILVAETNPEWVTFQLDVAWATDAGVDAAALITEYADRIDLLHVKDAVNLNSAGNPSFRNLGEGNVPLQEILAAGVAADIDYFVMEYDVAADGESFAAEGFEYLTGIPAGTGEEETVVDRIAGANRYEVAVNISQAAYPETAPVVYVASGENYPDALSAGPAAAFEGGPLLLVKPGELPAVIGAEIARLAPEKIVVVGGPASVDDDVFYELSGMAAETVRIAGANRFEVSRNVAQYAFGDEVPLAYIATGEKFPDALTAGGAAGSQDAPVILVRGSAADLDDATAALLADFGTTQTRVLGGSASVSPGVFSDIKALTAATRLGGADRYEAARAINADAFTSADRAFIATGLNFPDALAGSAWAAASASPMYVAPGSCITPGVLADLEMLGVTHVTLLGGEASLTPDVFALTPCA